MQSDTPAPRGGWVGVQWGMLIRDLVAALDRIAPFRFAEPWDKVGLLLGAPADTLGGPILLTIDLTESVLDEAIGLGGGGAGGAGAIVAYHPPIFEPLARLTDRSAAERIILRAARAGLAMLSPHTALDAVPGGVCDWLCEGLSTTSPDGKIHGDCRALVPLAQHHHPLTPHPSTHEVKIVTFVPATHLDTVRNALATAGAGIIGHYRVCSFSTPGTGTFLGDPGTNPAVGESGTLQAIAEVRLEMVCSHAALPLALQTLRRFHPYEEPAIDVVPLVPQPVRNVGAGRRLSLDRPATVPELAARLRAFLHSPVRYADAAHGAPVKVVGVCAGSGGELADKLRPEGCEVFVTGELSHHKTLALVNAGVSVILGEHTGTERGYLPRLADKLVAALPGVDVVVSKADRDPLTLA